MRRSVSLAFKALAAAAAGALLLSGCGTSASDDSAGASDNAAGDPTWSVACTGGDTPVNGVGDLALPCLGDEADTAVGPREGRPMIVVLWASWCGPCAAEAPEVEAFYAEHGDEVDVLGVDTADTRDAGRWFAQEFAMTYPSVFDADEQVRAGLGVPALPGTAFVNPDGTVAKLVTEPGVTADSLTRDAEAAFGLDLS